LGSFFILGFYLPELPILPITFWSLKSFYKLKLTVFIVMLSRKAKHPALAKEKHIFSGQILRFTSWSLPLSGAKGSE